MSLSLCPQCLPSIGTMPSPTLSPASPQAQVSVRAMTLGCATLMLNWGLPQGHPALPSLAAPAPYTLQYVPVWEGPFWLQTLGLPCPIARRLLGPSSCPQRCQWAGRAWG